MKNRLFKELSVIEFDVNKIDIYTVKERDKDGNQEMKKFDNFHDAMKYYKNLDGFSETTVSTKKDIKKVVFKDKVKNVLGKYRNKKTNEEKN